MDDPLIVKALEDNNMDNSHVELLSLKNVKS